MPDATVVGSGPNGLAAAVVLSRAGLEVEVVEASPNVGGGCRSEAFDAMPGFSFDFGSAVHPFVPESEFFRRWEATARVPYLTPDVSFAHPLDGGRAAIAYRSLPDTVEGLGLDGGNWQRTFGRLARDSTRTADLALNPAIKGWRHPAELARVGAHSAYSALGGLRQFRGQEAAALFTGVMSHANTSFPSLATASVGLVLTAMAHGRGWPLPRGGAAALTSAMIQDIRHHGGLIHANRRITDPREVASSKIVLLDTSLASAVNILGDVFPSSYRRLLESKKPGNGTFKVDFVLNSPVPWTNPAVSEAPTVHLGGTAEEIQAAENCVSAGQHPEHPYVLLVQPTVIDPERAPGHHLVWAYCHVPNGSTVDMTEAILGQIERFAPGFRDTILVQQTSSPHQLEAANANLQGGDIGGGSLSGMGFVRRPHLGPHPWRTPRSNTYIYSSFVSPGPGVHGMGGYHAAHVILKDKFHMGVPDLGIAS